MASSYLDKIEADRQAQHSGTDIRRNGATWEVYCWERVTELQFTSYAISEQFAHKWEAEHFLYALKNR